MKFILGKKLGITQLFNEKGEVVPVTLIEAGPCFVSAIRSKKKHGYGAIQLAFVEKKKRKFKENKGSFQDQFRYLKEFRLKEEGLRKYKIGKKVKVSIFKEGDRVKVSAISKGKGFQGVVKRWKFAGSPASHGHRHDLRAPGSIGSSFPEKVIKGLKMAGRMGGERVTVKNLEVVKVDTKKNIIAVKGAIPGVKGRLVEVRSD